MADFSQLQSFLNSSRIASENNALYQTIKGLIDAVSTLAGGSAQIEALQALIDGISGINAIEVDTSLIAQNLDLSAFISGFTLFKDITGNAAANNITLTGTVDGVVNPVINTNYGYLGVFVGDDGLFHEWVSS